MRYPETRFSWPLKILIGVLLLAALVLFLYSMAQV